jgi:hypothetical protein
MTDNCVIKLLKNSHNLATSFVIFTKTLGKNIEHEYKIISWQPCWGQCQMPGKF